MQSIEQLWQSFAKIALNNINPRTVQYRETRRAFYAGAQGFMAQMTGDEVTGQPDEVGMKYLDECMAEFEQFRQDLLDGKA